MNQQMLIMEMFLITLISRVVYRKKHDDLELPECFNQETKDNKHHSRIDFAGKIIEMEAPAI